MERYTRNRIYVTESEQELVRNTRIFLGGAGIGSIIAVNALDSFRWQLGSRLHCRQGHV